MYVFSQPLFHISHYISMTCEIYFTCLAQLLLHLVLLNGCNNFSDTLQFYSYFSFYMFMYLMLYSVAAGFQIIFQCKVSIETYRSIPSAPTKSLINKFVRSCTCSWPCQVFGPRPFTYLKHCVVVWWPLNNILLFLFSFFAVLCCFWLCLSVNTCGQQNPKDLVVRRN